MYTIYRHEHVSNVIIPTCSLIISWCYIIVRGENFPNYLFILREFRLRFSIHQFRFLYLNTHIFTRCSRIVYSLWTFKLSFVKRQQQYHNFDVVAEITTNYQLECEMLANVHRHRILLYLANQIYTYYNDAAH